MKQTILLIPIVLIASLVCYRSSRAPTSPHETEVHVAQSSPDPIKIEHSSQPKSTTVRQVTWADLDAADTLIEWVSGLQRFGMDSDSIRALVALKQRRLLAGKVAMQPYHQRRDEHAPADLRRAQLEVESLLAQVGSSPADTGSQLSFLGSARREEILNQLGSFDAQIRALEYQNADGVWESDDWERYESLKNERHEALVDQLSLEERQDWIRQESPEAQELRGLVLELSKDQFDSIVEAKYEANQALAVETLTDDERNSIRSRLDEKLKTILNEEGFTQFRRAEDPYYPAFFSLQEKLGTDITAVNQTFDWHERVNLKDTQLRQQGLTDEEIISQMKPMTDQAKAEIERVMGSETFQRFKRLTQSLFLFAYDPVVHD